MLKKPREIKLKLTVCVLQMNNYRSQLSDVKRVHHCFFKLHFDPRHEEICCITSMFSECTGWVKWQVRHVTISGTLTFTSEPCLEWHCPATGPPALSLQRPTHSILLGKWRITNIQRELWCHKYPASRWHFNKHTCPFMNKIIPSHRWACSATWP